MKRAIIRIDNRMAGSQTMEAMGERFVRAWNRGAAEDPVASFVFSSPAQLFSVISPKRWELIERLQSIGPSSIRALARDLDRDVKRVHDDVSLLADWGIIERDEEGRIIIPFDVIHADFDLRAVA